MIPARDYNDFTKFVNENQTEGKQSILTQTMRQSHDFRTRNEGLPKHRGNDDYMSHKEASTLMTKTDNAFFKSDAGRNRTYSVDGRNLNLTQVKPKMLETSAVRKSEFFTLSEGFKSVFANDKIDQKMVVPVVGYGGHRRGDRSQNYFGKSFRETTLKSKCLERDFRSNSHR